MFCYVLKPFTRAYKPPSLLLPDGSEGRSNTVVYSASSDFSHRRNIAKHSKTQQNIAKRIGFYRFFIGFYRFYIGFYRFYVGFYRFYTGFYIGFYRFYRFYMGFYSFWHEEKFETVYAQKLIVVILFCLKILNLKFWPSLIDIRSRFRSIPVVLVFYRDFH